MPTLMIIIDGLTDDPQESLDGKTPLMAARCSALDFMRKNGAYGFFDTVPQGFAADSLTCISTLLGVPPHSLPVGRAYAEALSLGVHIGEDDAVCRCSLVTLDGGGRLLSACAAGASGKTELCRELAERLAPQGMSFVPMGGYKNLLVLRGCAKDARGVTTFAPHQHEGEPFEALLPRGASAVCGRLAELARASVTPHGAGALALLPWGTATAQSLPQFAALHGVNGAAVCATEVMRGIAIGMGMRVVTPQGATADSDTDLGAKARAALALLGGGELVLVHINGADELSHRKDAAGKTEFISRIDKELLAPLLSRSPKGTRFLVCSDHSALCATGGHRGEPQPFVLYGGAESGDMGTLDGTRAVEILLRFKT